jgi:transketolase N-terminal domain/subunit
MRVGIATDHGGFELEEKLTAEVRLVYTIWNRVRRFDPLDPIWPNRDRFVLSNGHASHTRKCPAIAHRE